MKEVIIYNRTSTEEQNPENQLRDCEALATRLGFKKEDWEVLEEQKSAFKSDEEREVFISLQALVKAQKIKTLIVWDLDRIYRNRLKLREFFTLCKTFGCKIYSFRQEWFETFNKMPSPFNEIMHDQMLHIMGWLAEEESQKKSERVKASIRKKDGQTLSYKGNKWGRSSLPKKVIEQIKELRQQGKSYSQITKEVFYFDKNNNKKFVSKTTINRALSGEES